MTEYERAVLKKTVDLLGDIEWDSDCLIKRLSDTEGMHAGLLGIKAVAGNASGSLKALLDAVAEDKPETATCAKCGTTARAPGGSVTSLWCFRRDCPGG